MKIEKISENQIRCTLTKEDLEARNIRVTELAYGSEKAKQLFRDMMVQAYRECGWTNESNIPLMIEAIPNKGDSLILNITKVDDPEELDTRFSKFTPTNVLPDDQSAPPVEGADDILDVFRRLFEQKKAMGKAGKKAAAGTKTVKESGTKTDAAAEIPKLTRAFRFEQLDEVLNAAASLRGFYNGDNSLYHSRKGGGYTLIINQSEHTPEDFNRTCNILSEYGSAAPYSAAAEAYLAEHGETVKTKNAVQELAAIVE